MNSATILHKKPGFLVPDLLLKKVSVACPTVFGFAGQEKGELKHEVLPKAIPLGELQALQQAFKDEHLVMFFANFPKAVIPDDVQPWFLNDSHGNPMVSIFYEGACKNYEGLNGDHTGEYCASDEIVFPRLLKAGEVAEGDAEKFIAELNKPGLQKVLGSVFDDRGVYVFLPSKGEPVCFGDNKLGGEFPWGRVSNTHGYTEVASTTEKVAEVAKAGLSFLRGRGASAETAPAPTPGVETPKPDVKVTPTPSVPASPGPVIPTDKDWEAKGYKRMFPPPKMGKGKARNLWLRTFNCIPNEQGNFGQLPPDFESSTCAVWVQPDLIELSQRSVTSKSEVDNLATSVHKFRNGGSALGVGKAVTPAKSEAEKDAETTAELARSELLSKPAGGEKPITRSGTREKYVPPASDYLPAMSDSEKETAINKLAGYLDPKNTKRPTPLEIQAGEAKWPTFSESTGIEFDELLFLPVAQIMDLFDGNKTAACAFIEMRRHYINRSGIKLEDLVLTGQEPKKVEEPAKVTPPAIPAEETTPKKGALSFLRGKQAA